MDIAEIRLRNLRALVARLEVRSPGLRRKDVALALDLSASFLSQLVGGKKMGDDVARKIEAAQRLDHGWMDSPQWEADPRIAETASPYGSQSVRTDAATLAASTRLVRLVCESMEVDFDPEDDDDAALILLGCSYLASRHEHIVTPDNVVDFTKLLRKRRRDGQSTQGSKGTGRTGAGTGT
jgi:hypothetical protein